MVLNSPGKGKLGSEAGPAWEDGDFILNLLI